MSSSLFHPFLSLLYHQKGSGGWPAWGVEAGKRWRSSGWKRQWPEAAGGANAAEGEPERRRRSGASGSGTSRLFAPPLRASRLRLLLGVGNHVSHPPLCWAVPPFVGETSSKPYLYR